MLTGYDTDKISRFIAMKHQSLEDLFYVLAQTGRHVNGAEVILVYLVWNELVCYLGFVKRRATLVLAIFSFITDTPVNSPTLLL